MQWDTLAGHWAELKGRLREQWGRLTNDDLDVIAGKRDQLVGILEQRYGKAKDDIEREVRAFEQRLARST